MHERLQKILSARGIASRRKAEEYIERGLVTVNGIVAKIGDKADPRVDRIEVDGQVLQERQEMLYYVLNKPVGVVTTNATHAKQKTVKDLIPKALQHTIVPIGRLDKDSSGLLLLSNDGVLAYRLTHPKFFHEKEYDVTVDRHIPDSALEKLSAGMIILGERTKPAQIRRIDDGTFRIAITEGKNRQIRRMCEKVGRRVVRLHRVRIVTLTDDRLTDGALRPLTAKEVAVLKEAVGMKDGDAR